MKKKIANGLEIVLLVITLLILNTASIKVVPYDYPTATPGSIKPLSLMFHYVTVYPMLFFYAVCIIMCLISIFVKKDHRDGRIHGISAILLFVFANWNLIALQDQVGDWFIVSYGTFPAMLVEVCLIGAVVISIAKRSTIIAGHPITEIRNQSSQADELKKYKDLLDSGAITQEEYEEKKKQLLGL